MKKGQVFEGTVSRVDFPNKGIIMIDDRKVAVKNCIKGQKVSFAVNRVRSGKVEGRILKVLEKSELESRDQACKYSGLCGGCSYQTIPYDIQLKIKEEQVKHLIDKACSDYTFEGILASPSEWGYRNKMEFSFGDEFKDGPLSLGLHKRGNFHDILTVDDCAIVDKDYNRILSCVLDYFKKLGADYYHMFTHEGYLRHLVIRKAAKSGEILINIITTSQLAVSNNKSETNIEENTDSITMDFDQPAGIKEKDIYKELTDLLLKLPLTGNITGILHSSNDGRADVARSDNTVILYGRDFICEELLGLKFKITTFSFFQTNSLGAEVLYSKVREYAGETGKKRIYDLYSGTGTIAQLLAPAAQKITGVEIIGEAVEAARENAALNGLDNCEFIEGDVLKVIDDLIDKPDIIILDPPRDGIHPKALEKIINFGVERIVYISCNPVSLVRDLRVLQENGYKVGKVCAVDMFPQTTHVECVSQLVRIK